jgi:MFS family permease
MTAQATSPSGDLLQSISVQRRPWRLLVAAFGANSIAYAGWYVQPEQFHELDIVQGLGQTVASIIVSAEITTAALVSIVLGYFIASKAPRRVMSIGVLIVLLGHVLALFASGFGEFLASRVVAGVGEGLLWIALNAAIALLDDPHKRYGQVNAATAVLLAVLVAVVPYADEHLARGVFVALVVTVVLFTPTLIPFFLAKRVASGIRPPLSVTLVKGWVLVAAVVVWNLVITVTYALSGIIGARTSAPTSQVDLAIAFSLVGVICGAATTAWLGLRFGRVLTIAVLTVIGIIAAFANIYWITLPGFAISLFVVNFCLYCVFSYLLGLAAELDLSGGTSAAVAGAFALGGGLSPVFGSYLIELTGGYGSIAWVIVLGGAVMFVVTRWLEPRHVQGSNWAPQGPDNG